MISPDDESKAFVARWNTLIAALIIEPSIKLVARTAVEYGLADGEDIYPGNERLARQTGLSARCVQEAWHFLRAEGMAARTSRSSWDGGRRDADAYELAIPEDWRSLGILGPRSGRFSCQHCGKKFNPQAANTWKFGPDKRPVIEHGNRVVMWAIPKLAFCPAPRSGPTCISDWNLKRRSQDEPEWSALDGAARWAMFRAARSDDWE